ncbi:Uncharacterised protein [Klebsiella pneumoniae]|nr:Uncharacterised protein [Klebsiella pneumoniae]
MKLKLIVLLTLPLHARTTPMLKAWITTWTRQAKVTMRPMLLAVC